MDNKNDEKPQSEQEAAQGGGSVSTSAQKTEDFEADAIQQLENARKELLYLRADFDNYRKRMMREQEQSIRFANERFVKELMALVDQFDRALEHGEGLKPEATGAFKNFLDGIEMTRRELNQMLSRMGVELIGQSGEQFDPSRHEAVSEQPTGDAVPGSVLAVIHKGCLLHGRLVQPAKVIVAQEPKTAPKTAPKAPIE